MKPEDGIARMTALQQSQRAIIHMEAEQSVLMGGSQRKNN